MLKVTEMVYGRLLLDGHDIPLADPVRVRLSAWLDYRHATCRGQWWVTTAGGYSAFAASGSGGQLIEVVPAKSLVVIFSTYLDTAGSGPSRIGTLTGENLVSTVIVPALP